MKLSLYPRKQNLIGGMIVGVACMGLTAVLPSISPQVGFQVTQILSLLGMWLIGYYGFRVVRPKPSFEADMDGFSVYGSKVYPWSEFRGVQLHGLSVNFIPAGRWVVVKVGKGIFGRKLHIKWTHLSASPKKMASQIAHFADVARAVGEVPVQAQTARPATQPASGPAAPSFGDPKPSFAQRFGDTAGPVQSTPRLSERLFGRRKVI